MFALRNAAMAGHLLAFRRVTGLDRLIDLSANKKLFLAAAIGIASLVLIGAVASQLVGNVKRQSDITDRQHAMLIEIAAIAVNSGHMERLERDLTLNEAARTTAYIEANAHIGRSNAALQGLVPADSQRRPLLSQMSRLVEQQRARLLMADAFRNPGWVVTNDKPHMPASTPDVEAIEELAERIWLEEKAELESSQAVEQQGFERIRLGAEVIGIIACLPGVLLLVLLRHEVIMQRRTAAGLAAANDGLDLKVRERTAQLAAANVRLTELSTRIEVARETERIQIAREVHDELGSTLTALKFDLVGSYGNGYMTSAGVTRKRVCRASVELVDAAMQTVRNILTVLRPNVLDKFGLWEAIRWKVEEFQQRMDIPCHLVVDENIPMFPSEPSISIYRVVEEALTNVARHANATRVDIVIRMQSDKVQVKISDNGSGITTRRALNATGFGITSMQERAKLLGGAFRILPNDPRGTTVWLDVPLMSVDGSAQA